MPKVAPKEASTSRSEGPKGECELKESMITSLRVAVSKERSYNGGGGRF